MTGVIINACEPPTRSKQLAALGFCPVCGAFGAFTTHEPETNPCRRNTFLCAGCGSVARNRHIAYSILKEFQEIAPSDNLMDFAETYSGTIWIGCVKEAVSKSLGTRANIIKTEFIDGVLPGDCREDGVICQDIQKSTFPDESFDLIISEDVIEHVPDPEAAFREVRRILKLGGKHIFTVPVVWDEPKSFRRASLSEEGITHHHPPEMHGDPHRPGGALAFHTFGADVIERYCSLTGPTRVLTANGDRLMESAFRIYNNWVFVSEKVATY